MIVTVAAASGCWCTFDDSDCRGGIAWMIWTAAATVVARDGTFLAGKEIPPMCEGRAGPICEGRAETKELGAGAP